VLAVLVLLPLLLHEQKLMQQELQHILAGPRVGGTTKSAADPAAATPAALCEYCYRNPAAVTLSSWSAASHIGCCLQMHFLQGTAPLPPPQQSSDSACSCPPAGAANKALDACFTHNLQYSLQ